MKILKISLFITLFSIFNLSFAIDAPQNITLEKATNSSLQISWDKVEGAGAYLVSYGTKSASGGVYENDSDPVGENNITLENLKSNTKYYIAVKAYDEDTNESEYSEEKVFSTTQETGNLKVEKANVIDSKNIDLEFNVNLDKNEPVNLNIVNKEDDLDEIELENYKIEDNILHITVNKKLKPNTKYSITIITAKGSNGETIKAGVEGIIDFITPENFKKLEEEKIEDLNSAGISKTQTQTGETIEENANKQVTNSKKTLGGKVIDNKNIVEKVAKNKKDLPTTGPAETLLFLFFSLFAGAMFMFLRRKVNS